MFFDEKTKTFRRLKRVLRDLQTVESDLNKRDFRGALKDLRKGLFDNKKFMVWLGNHKATKDLVYGTNNLLNLF